MILYAFDWAPLTIFSAVYIFVNRATDIPL